MRPTSPTHRISTKTRVPAPARHRTRSSRKKFNLNGLRRSLASRGRPMIEPMSNMVPGACVSLGLDVRRIVAGNAGLMTGPGTNTYLLGSREIAVLDPGPHDDAHLRAIMAAAGGIVRWVIVTHTHR